MYNSLPELLTDIGYMYNDTDGVARLELLRQAIMRANEAYNNDKPILNELDYNELIVLTHGIEDAYKLTRTDDCSVVTGDTTLKPMYSLNKVYDTEKLIKFLSKFDADDKVLIEPKLDGVSMVVCYRDCVFSHIQLKTRRYNAEQARNLPIRNIDKIINETTPLSSVDVRGEVVIELDRYELHVDTFSNARTMVASMLNTKEPQLLGYDVDLFDFIVFETMPAVDVPSAFDVVDSTEYSVKAAIEVIKQDDLHSTYGEVIPYLLDGLVFKVPAYEHLGYTKKFPRNHIALKYLSESVVSTITDIVVEETTKGVRQSVRIAIEPTSIGGVTVRSINLGSVKVLASLVIKIGYDVKFTLSGGIIPIVLEVIPTDI